MNTPQRPPHHHATTNSMSIEEAVAAGIIANPDGSSSPASRRGGSKYGVAAQADRRRGPRLYASKGEMLQACELYGRRDGGDLLVVVEQPLFVLGEDTTYRPDFLTIDSSGHIHAIDFKGVETPDFKRIKKLWAKYGQCSLHVMMKQGDRFVTREIVWPPDTARYCAPCRNCGKPRPGPEPLGVGARASERRAKGGGRG